MTSRACLVGVAIAVASSQPASSENFSGSTPCGPVARAFLGIPAGDNCERVQWELSLDRSTFELRATHGLQAVNAPGFAAGARDTRLRGTWSNRGPLPSYSNSAVYQLSSERGDRIALALIDGVLLQILDGEGGLLRGDGGWSYTLTREGGRAPAPRRTEPLASIPAGAGGDFEGRTPCREVSRLLGRDPQPDCVKLKWALTLSQNGGFELEGTLYRSAPRRGTWAVRRDTTTGADVYVLDPGRAGSLALLKAGQDVLFFLDSAGAVLRGNSSHGYTLNRSVR